MESCSIWRTSWCSVAHDITCSWGQRNSARSQDCSRGLLTLKSVQKALSNVATPNLNKLYYIELSSQHKKKPQQPEEPKMPTISHPSTKEISEQKVFFGLRQVRSNDFLDITAWTVSSVYAP